MGLENQGKSHHSKTANAPWIAWTRLRTVQLTVKDAKEFVRFIASLHLRAGKWFWISRVYMIFAVLPADDETSGALLHYWPHRDQSLPGGWAFWLVGGTAQAQEWGEGRESIIVSCDQLEGHQRLHCSLYRMFPTDTGCFVVQLTCGSMFFAYLSILHFYAFPTKGDNQRPSWP